MAKDKNIFDAILESMPYSSKAAGRRKASIESQTEEPAPNSYEQYQREKAAGGPNTESFEEWKKL